MNFSQFSENRMRFFQLSSYFSKQFFKALLVRAFIFIVALLCIFLFITPTFPLPRMVYQICSMLVLAYYVVATAGSIIERTQLSSVELILAKPFTRRDIILADFLSIITTTSILTLLLTLVVTLAYGIRWQEWSTTFLGLAISLNINFFALYGFILLSGILLKNIAVVTVLWIGYVYVGAILLETRSEFIYQNLGSHSFVQLICDGVYYLLPQLYAVSRAITLSFSDASSNLLPLVFTITGGIAALTCSVYLFNRQELE